MFSRRQQHVRRRPIRIFWLFHRRRKLCFLIWTLCVACVAWNSARVPHLEDLIPSEQEKNERNVKYILYYTPFWNHKDYKIGFGQEPFQACCFRKNCFATDDRQYLNSVGDFHAVVFHAIDTHIDEQELALIRQWRQPHQRFIYFNVESPQTYPSMNGPPGFYNWTMTYLHDSDIVRPYGWFEENNHSEMYPHTLEWPVVYNEQDFLQRKDLSTLMHLAKRPKKVPWIASNCNTTSGRDQYVRELSKYIQVDTFGKCGAQSCDINYQQGQNKLDNCTLAVNKDYKFYLSFENSLCKDYVTEKFYSRVNQSVAIVMGAANYSQVAPPHSYINVMDYASPRELAKYLLELDHNDSMYLSYFWWKQHYTVKTGSRDMQVQAFCQLCDKLHNNQDERPKSYASLRDWWTIDARCGEVKVPGLSPLSPSLRVDWKNG